MVKNELYEKFKVKLLEIEHLASALGVLDWDSSVNMPPKGAKERARTVATLSSVIHEKALAKDYEALLLKLKSQLDKKLLSRDQSVVVRESFRVYSKEKKLPASFVNELAQVISAAHTVWVEARKTSDFKKFAPILAKIVELKRQQAKYIGFKDNPYDALLDDFEPGLTTEEVSQMFADLKEFLVPMIHKIAKSKVRPNEIKFKGKIDLQRQKDFNRKLAEKLGYDFEAGRMVESAHPFSAGFNPGDARVTTRYSESDVFYSLGSTIHEVGHALYEQGLKPEHFGTPLGNHISLGIHESQSRMWENLVGKSLPFWKYFYPVVQKEFPEAYKKIKLEDFYLNLNRVMPSLIRVESDEVTYNMHVVIRFELEKELIDGSIEVKDLAKIWNDKYYEYLGVKVPNDAQGVLQDVHWSAGLFGYFPTYTLGNLYSAQFFNKARQDIMNLDRLFEKGKFQPLLEWLRKNIHQHGRLYTAGELCKRVTGEPLNSDHYVNYISAKYVQLYQL
jgi:carboxypeptidase Taq